MADMTLDLIVTKMFIFGDINASLGSCFYGARRMPEHNARAAQGSATRALAG
ncbi:hypothetical protein [Gallaecimonas pentaromativorans]|uniref:hypothetical protein n=1 Tax=Gallaecimonas pentaromativorans TaxID=584787 RepID=UPI00147441BF|nr:hypothetical protein [Gallaecimonas pentaromativorans]